MAAVLTLRPKRSALRYIWHPSRTNTSLYNLIFILSHFDIKYNPVGSHSGFQSFKNQLFILKEIFLNLFSISNECLVFCAKTSMH